MGTARRQRMGAALAAIAARNLIDAGAAALISSDWPVDSIPF